MQDRMDVESIPTQGRRFFALLGHYGGKMRTYLLTRAILPIATVLRANKLSGFAVG